jgi:CheY-like chemotaxis protein
MFLGFCGLLLVPLFTLSDGILAPGYVNALLPWRAAAFLTVCVALGLLAIPLGRRHAVALGVVITVAISLQVDAAAVDPGSHLLHYHLGVIVGLLLGALFIPWSPQVAAATTLIVLTAYFGGTVALMSTRALPALLPQSLILAVTAVAVVAGAVARAHADRRERARQATASAHSRRQEALATLSQLALAAREPLPLLEHATALVARTLEVPFAGAFEVCAAEKRIRLRSGAGWQAGTVGRFAVDMQGESLLKRILSVRAPVIVRDHARETHVGSLALVQTHRLASSVGVIIPLGGEPYGVLSAHTPTPRAFSEAEVEFLQTVAHVLGTTIARHQHELVHERDAESAEALARAGRELLASLDTRVLLGRLCTLSAELLHADHSSTWLVQWPDEMLSAASQSGIPWEEWARLTNVRFPVETMTPFLRRLNVDHVVHVGDSVADDGARALLQALGVSSATIALLRRGEMAIGIQVSGWTTAPAAAVVPRPRVVHGIMQLAAAALTNAHLVEQLDRRRDMSAESPAEGSSPPDPGDAAQLLARTRQNLTRASRIATAGRAPHMRRRKRLLFADDLAMTRTLLFRFLKEAMPDIEVLEAPDGPQAVAIAEAEQPDVVLLDLRMTEMDGWEAARRIRALPGNDRLPIIATSVTASPEIEEQVRRAGFTEFIPKPVSDYSLLLTRLEHYLRGPSAAGVDASAWMARGEASRRLH